LLVLLRGALYSLSYLIDHPSVSLESATSSSQARDKDRSSPFLPRTVINLSAKVLAGTKDTKRHWGKGFACTGRSKECTKVEICVLDPGEKHLGLEKKDLQASLTNSSLKEDVTSQ